MNVLKKLFQFVLTIQVILLAIFLIENINSLDDIEYVLNIGADSIDFNLNIYSTLAIMLFIFAIILVSSISILGGGINEEGTRTLGKYLGLFMIYIIMQLGTAYYIFHLAELGILLLIFFTLIYVLFSFNSFLGSGSIDVE